jgi:hypothetical protein
MKVKEITESVTENTHNWSAMELSDLIKAIDHVDSLWLRAGHAGQGDEDVVDYDEAEHYEGIVSWQLDDLRRYLLKDKHHRQDPLVQQVFQNAKKAGIIDYDLEDIDTVKEKEIAGTKSGKYATMKDGPEDYLDGQKFVGG